MNRFIPALAAACFAMSATAFAQTPPPSGERKAPTPEQREQFKQRIKAAQEACKDNADRRGCMTTQFCAKAPDPAKCQAEGKQRMAERMESRQKAHEACTGKRGDELTKCLQDQPGMKGHHGRHKG